MGAGSGDLLQGPMLCHTHICPDSIPQLQSIDLFTVTYSWLGKGLAKVKKEQHINLFAYYIG